MRATATGKTRPEGKPKGIKHIFLADELTRIEEKLGYVFRDKHLLAQALIHRSYLNEVRTDGVTHNERLEFLGDAVLEIAVTQYLFRNCTALDEGMLTAVRGAMVNSQAIARYAEQLELAEHIRLSRGERKDFDLFKKARTFIMADAFEAVVGAVYLDRGTGAAELFIAETVLPYLDDVLERKLYLDAKSHLQELSQERDGVTPQYEVVAEEGPDHAKEFTMVVYLGSRRIGCGVGNRKQEAQVEAAKEGLLNEFGIVLDEYASPLGKKR